MCLPFLSLQWAFNHYNLVKDYYKLETINWLQEEGHSASWGSSQGIVA